MWNLRNKYSVSARISSLQEEKTDFSSKTHPPYFSFLYQKQTKKIHPAEQKKHHCERVKNKRTFVSMPRSNCGTCLCLDRRPLFTLFSLKWRHILIHSRRGLSQTADAGTLPAFAARQLAVLPCLLFMVRCRGRGGRQKGVGKKKKI